MPNVLDLEPIHSQYWSKFKTIINNDRLAQALIFVGSALSQMDKLINRLIALQLCISPQASEPCLKCVDCRMLIEDGHPDVLYIQPEKLGTVIKIEQIRFLQTDIYQTPQRVKRGFVVIKSAENMNKASANALLKILEEPPEYKQFILIAEHVATLPATILSRCQLWRINTDNHADYLQELTDHIFKEKQSQLNTILQDLLSLVKGDSIPSILAANWKAMPLQELCYLLYLINVQILMMIYEISHLDSNRYSLLKELAPFLSAKKIFHQLGKINALQRKLIHNIHINNVLAIEDLLMDLCQGEIYAR